MQHLAMAKWTASTLEENSKKKTDKAANEQCSHHADSLSNTASKQCSQLKDPVGCSKV